MEAYMLCHLKGNGIPIVKSFGYNNNYNILVMELLGNSLEDLFQKQKRKFTLKTTCMLGIQIIDRIEWVHSKLVILNLIILLWEETRKIILFMF